ncbi:transmembrane protease serine 9-like [Cochliomyia hominivorax]
MGKLTIFTCLTFSLIGLNLAQPIGRIVGGVDAIEGQFPYQISLRLNGSHICGGSIISRNYILTAAHCVGDEDEGEVYHPYDPNLFTIRAGSTNRLMGGVVKQVAKIIVHENYGNFLNDVALLKLESSLVYSDGIKPIPLATAEIPVGSNVVISGWGRLKTGGDSPIRLQWNTLEFISKLQCFTSIFMSSDALICLAHQQDNGACNGDSGGPAVFNGELVGVAGFVVGGCGTKNPDGYAKVFYHVAWIKEHSDLYYTSTFKRLKMKLNNSIKYLLYIFWILKVIAGQIDDYTENFVPVTQQALIYLPQPRIVGGQNAMEKQFPYQISLRIFNRHICGGSIISKNFVVTAAHCVTITSKNKVRKLPVSIMSIHAGSIEVNTGGIIRQVSEVKVHPNYENFNNDIAVIKMQEPLEWSEHIQQVSLAEVQPEPGAEVITSGWGRLRTGGGIPQILQYNKLFSIGNEECRRLIGNVPPSVLCLGHIRGNGVCNGDSGGPAVYNNSLVGITNFIVGECGSNIPDGYASISYLIKWINSNTDL